MYIPEVYREKDLEQVRKFLREHPFATMVSQIEGQLWATHIPLHYRTAANGDDLLHGHIAKKNPQWKELEEQELLAIFQGPDAYISSSWYHEESVPTWNYRAVHAYGRARILEGQELVESLKALVDEHEKDEKDPVSVDRMSKEFFEKELKGLVGFEIRVERFHAAAKLSQDKENADKDSVMKRLEEKEDPKAHEVAREMKKRQGRE